MTDPNVTVTHIEKCRTISPYDLSFSNNPGATISHPSLNRCNYDEWVCNFKTALQSRKMFGFLDGTISQPLPASPDFEDWEPINALLVLWIKMSVDSEVRSNLSHRPLARDLWDHIKKLYAVSSGPKNQQVKADLANCKQGSISVEQYYGKLLKIWESVASHRLLRVYTCGQCTCNLTTLQERDREEDRVQQFLYGLDDIKFGGVRSTLTLRVPLPGLEEAYISVRQDEDMQRNTKAREVHGEASAFAVQTRTRPPDSRNNDFCPIDSRHRERFDDDKQQLCKLCNRSGHHPDNCFAYYGYLEWSGDRPPYKPLASRGRGRGPGSGRSNYTTTSRANAISTHATGGSVDCAKYVITDRDRDAVAGLTDDQWKVVTALVNARTVAPPDQIDTLTGPQYTDIDWSW